MKDVYSYLFPEVRRLIGGLSLNPEFMINTLGADRASELLLPYDFEPALSLPSRHDGSLDLDELHLPVIERIREKVSASLPGLKGYDNVYPNHGSSQAMFTLLAEWKAQGKFDTLAVLDGEYEGYAANAGNLKIPVTKYKDLNHKSPKDGEMWFVSNPSALDGNWIDHDNWKSFVNAGHQIVYDAAYVGLTPGGMLDVSSPNIRAVLTSPSKIFGVFRYRNTGVTYTREPVASMYGTKWFKDVPALLDTLKLYESFGDQELPRHYRPVQEKICQSLGEVVGSEVVPSDVLLLGTSEGPVRAEFTDFKRASSYRFGLTKLLEDYENWSVTASE